MKVGILLSNEWRKARLWLGFRVPVLSFATLIGGLFALSYYGARRRGQAPDALPEAWSDILGGISQMALFFVAIVLLLLISSEFTWRTARQNVIDGLSKEEWFVAKLMLVPLVALLFILIQVAFGGGFALAGTDFSAVTGPLIGAVDLAALGGALLAALGFGSLAFMIAFLVRSSGAAIGVFFLFVVAVESLLKDIFLQFKALTGLAPRLPTILFRSLLQRVLYDPTEATAAVEAALKAGKPAPVIPSTAGQIALACGYIALFIGVAFLVHRRRDL